MPHLPPDNHPALIYLDTLTTEISRQAMRKALNEMAEMLGYPDMLAVDWSQLSFEDVFRLREKLVETYEPSTVNRHLTPLRSVLKQAYLLGQMSAEDYKRVSQINNVEDEPVSPGREPSQEEIAAIMAACDNGTLIGKRDAAVIALMYVAGLRPTELSGLKLGDYKDRKLVIRGKYNMQRTLYIEGGALEALEDWLAVRGRIAGPLFPAFTSTDSFHLGRKMKSQTLSHILTARGESAGVEGITPSDLRQSFIKHLLEVGIDIVSVGELAGIKDIRAIARYVPRMEGARKKAAKALKVPYKRRT